MTTIEEVRDFTAHLNIKLDACDHGEGTQCATMDAAANHYAQRCWEFREAIRQWAQDIFAGRVVYNQQVELFWLNEARNLYLRAKHLRERCVQAESICFELSGVNSLSAILFELDRLLHAWVTPARSVGPSPRQQIPEAVVAEMAKRMAELPQPAGG